MARQEIVDAARMGLFASTFQLKQEIEALSNKLNQQETDGEEIEQTALDVRDAYAIFEAARHFYDVARNQ